MSLIHKLVSRVVAQQAPQYVFARNRERHQEIPGDTMPESWWRIMAPTCPHMPAYDDIRTEYISRIWE